jgi:hypothetical protein
MAHVMSFYFLCYGNFNFLHMLCFFIFYVIFCICYVNFIFYVIFCICYVNFIERSGLEVKSEVCTSFLYNFKLILF